MIFDFFIIIFLGIVKFIFKPILESADASLPSGLSSSITTFSTDLSYIGHFIDLDSLKTAVGLLLILEGVILSIKLFNFIIRKIPGIS